MWSWCGVRGVASVAERDGGGSPRRAGCRRRRGGRRQVPRVEPPLGSAPGAHPATGAAASSSRIAREEEQAEARPSWSDLPADLIGQVLVRLPSHADRVRLRAVCRSWRADAKRQAAGLPPPLPWLALRDVGLLDLDGAPIRTALIQTEGTSSFLAVDNLAFLEQKDGGCCLVNPLSGSMAIPLPQLADAVLRARMKFKWDVYTKVILSSPPDSSMDPLIAALISEHHYVVISTCKHHDAISVGYDSNVPLADIAFLNGELYALTMKEGLYVYSPNNGCLGAPMNVSPGGFHQRITDAPKERELYYFLPGLLYVVSRYLAVCDGRLFMVRRWLSVPAHTRLGDEERTSWFEVLEADLTIAPCQWRRVHRLGGHAIFLGSKCTKFVRASQCVGGVQEDCIYFMHRIYDNQAREYWGLHADPLGDSGVYNMRTGAIKPLLPESRLAELPLKHQFPTWFFPADL